MKTPLYSKHSHPRTGWAALSVGIIVFLLGAVPLAGAPQGRNGIADTEIRRAIQRVLIIDEAVSSHLVDVKVTEGVVTLSGSVATLLQKERAARQAETIRGVRSVVNMIDVRPVVRTDKQIRQDLIEAFALDPATESYEIQFEVDAGTVTLQGKVESYAEKALATRVAKSVKGIKTIHNSLDVYFDKDRPDVEILGEVKRQLVAEPYAPQRFINVDVNKGEVVLSGTVGSAAAKREAYLAGWVAGVKTVDTSDLQIEWWTALEDDRKSMKAYDRTAKEIKQSVVDALAHDPRTKSYNIDVSVENDVVTLSGVVDNLKSKHSAERDALNTPGVRDVNNYLVVRFANLSADQEVTQRVESALIRDPVLERHEISVEVRNNKVYLYGDIDNLYEKRHAEDVVSRVIGVADVQNRLYIGDEWRWKSDSEIKRDITNELYWDWFVDESTIELKVEDAVATLEGEVGSWKRLEAAVDDAFDGGAKLVVSYLDVQGGNEITPRYFYRHSFVGTTDYF